MKRPRQYLCSLLFYLHEETDLGGVNCDEPCDCLERARMQGYTLGELAQKSPDTSRFVGPVRSTGRLIASRQSDNVTNSTAMVTVIRVGVSWILAKPIRSKSTRGTHHRPCPGTRTLGVSAPSHHSSKIAGSLATKTTTGRLARPTMSLSRRALSRARGPRTTLDYGMDTIASLHCLLKRPYDTSLGDQVHK